jgi:arylsulfatase A-like enzyme
MAERQRRATSPLRMLLVLGVALTACGGTAGTATTPVNIAIVVADDLGTYDLSVMGHPSIRTPFLDRLAAEGALFTQWLSAAPICTPSRSSLYTGRLPIRTGLYADQVPVPRNPKQDNGTFGLDAWMKKDGAGGLPSTEVTLPELLKGHRSLLCGKWHLGQIAQYWPRQHGFDHYLGTISTHDHGSFKFPDGTKIPAPCTVLVRDDNITHRLTNGRLASPENLSPPGWPATYPADGGGPDPTRAAKECSIPSVTAGGDGALPLGVDELIPLYTNETTSFIRSSIAAKVPFLMVYTPDNTHLPVYASSAFLGKSQRGLYGDAVEELDWSVGQILAAIEPVKDSTFVVFSSDNGAQGGGGNNGCQGLLRCMKGTISDNYNLHRVFSEPLT